MKRTWGVVTLCIVLGVSIWLVRAGNGFSVPAERNALDSPMRVGHEKDSHGLSETATEQQGRVRPSLSSDYEGENSIFVAREGKLRDVFAALGLTERFSEAADILELNMDDWTTATPRQGRGPSFDRLVLDVGASGSLMFEGDGLDLRSFIREEVQVAPRGLTHDDAIPKEQALEIGQVLLDALGIEADLSKGGFVGMSDAVSSEERDLAYATWDIGFNRMYEGYLTYSGIRMSIDAYSGTVNAISNAPFVPPKNMDVRVSREEALEIAKRFVSERDVQVQDTSWLQKEIGIFTSVTDPSDAPVGAVDSLEARLVYRVLLDGAQESSAPGMPQRFVLNVDCGTGEVLRALGPRAQSL